MIQHPYILEWTSRETVRTRLLEAEQARLVSLLPRRSWRAALADACLALANRVDDPEPEPTGPAAISAWPSDRSQLAA